MHGRRRQSDYAYLYNLYIGDIYDEGIHLLIQTFQINRLLLFTHCVISAQLQYPWIGYLIYAASKR